MKILLNLIAAKQGGQVTRANEFINKFQSSANKGDLLIILLSNFNPLEIKNNKSIQVIKVHFPFNLKNWLARIIWENTEQLYWVRTLRPDIYLTFSHALPFTNLKIPTVVAVSNLAPFSKHAFIRETLLGKIRLLLLKYFIIFFTNKATSVIALSQLGRKNLIDNGVFPSKITKIMIGVKKQEQQDKVKKNKIYKINEKYILYVSHFYKYKNFEQLILAYSSLPKSTQDIYGLKLVGNFSDKKYVEKLIQMSNNLGLSNRIDFIPGLKEKELNLVYKQASLFVLSSVIENCPSVLLEAMANQLPVLVTNVSPMPEFVKNAGKYFEIGDHLELSKNYNKNFTNIKSSKNYTFLKRKKIVLKNLYKKKGKFLDVGTGSGEITSILINNNNFSNSTLVDISNLMLKKCKKKIKNKKGVKFINKDLLFLSTRRKFNYIICLGVIAHYPNINKLVSKISSLSKKNSIVIVQSSLLNFFTVKMNKFFSSKRYYANNKYNVNYITEKKLLELFINNDFEIIKIYKYSLSLPILDKFLPKLNFYLDYYFDFLFKNIGAEAIFVLKKN